MRSSCSRSMVLLAALSLGASGCSLLLSFDPEGQPCDSTNGCLPGYGCGADKQCRKGTDAGPTDTCKPGERFSPTSQKCIPNTCQFKTCAVGKYCSDDAGIPTCRDALTANLGAGCIADSACTGWGPGRVCYRGSIQIDSAGGSLRTGACVEPCPSSGGPCTTAGAVRKTYALGADGGSVCICIPNNMMSPCVNNDACKEDGLVCTVFDHPMVGPATICDAPGTGAEVTEQCVLSTKGPDGGTFGRLCKNGLCVPRTLASGQQGVCGELCDVRGGAPTCAAPKLCALSEFSLLGVPRQVPLCIPKKTRCSDCSLDAGQCGIDAPNCTNFQGSPRCLAACSPDAGNFPSCPPGFGCADNDAGFYCAPLSGLCVP